MSTTHSVELRHADRNGKGSGDISEDRLINRVYTIVTWTIVACSGLLSWRLVGLIWMYVPMCACLMVTTAVLEVLEPGLRGFVAERRVRRLLRRLELSAVHNVFVLASSGQRAQLDHVVFLGKAVALIETKSVTGIIGRKGGRWTRMFYGRERCLPGRTPQQQVLDAREVLAAAYPAWDRRILAFTVLTHGVLGEGLEANDWVMTADALAITMGRFRCVPDDQAYRRWRDLSRFLRANRATWRDTLRFLRMEVLNPKNFSRTQLIAVGMIVGASFPFVIGGLIAGSLEMYFHGIAWLSHSIAVAKG